MTASAIAPTAVRTNIAVTMLCRLGSGALNFAAAPLYARLVGLEGYGLIGFYLSLQALLQILEVGLTTAAGRELAMGIVRPESARASRDFVRTTEAVYWMAAIVFSAAGPLIGAALSHQWLRFDQITGTAATAAVSCMVATMALQWPASFYFGALMAVQRQVTANVIFGAGAVVRVVLSLAVLKFVSQSVTAFFIVQGAAVLLTTVVMAGALWRSLPSDNRRPQLRPRLLKGAIGLSAGISAVSLFTTCLNQADKVILSRYMLLSDYGAYMLACTLAATLYMLVAPICTSVFPRLSQHVALGEIGCVTDLYAKSAQIVSALVGPAALVTLLFAGDIVLVWTRDAGIAAQAGAVAATLAPAILMSAYLEVSLGVQRAFGWTRFSLQATIVATMLVIPAVILGVRNFGPVGGAGAFAVVKVLLAVVQIVYTDRALPAGSPSVWNFRDIGLPLAAGLTTVAACRWFFSDAAVSVGRSALAVGVTATLAYAVVFAATPVAAAVAGDALRMMERRFSTRLRVSS